MSTVKEIAEQLERSFHGGAWHGPALSEVLDGVDATLAANRPIGQAHNIWEIAGHLTTWYQVPLRRLAGERVGDVPPEMDWPAAEDVTEESWRQVLDELAAAHRELHAMVVQLDDEDLDRPVAGSDPTVRGLLLGVIQHNAYHGGQIALLKKVSK